MKVQSLKMHLLGICLHRVLLESLLEFENDYCMVCMSEKSWILVLTLIRGLMARGITLRVLPELMAFAAKVGIVCRALLEPRWSESGACWPTSVVVVAELTHDSRLPRP